ncbi:hypothetical protein [Jiangella anatolica]|uniref:hypothetical protein n=1 Tax=Jiangella anatolica TaxID=2670374 RepID=UPI0011B6831F|nr:hypothetical protein [Jiangella anatolica]
MSNEYLSWAKLNYPGDLRGKIEGQVVGPNRMGELFVIRATEYNAETDVTTAHLAYATTEDVEK